jgi:hypothetical protein
MELIFPKNPERAPAQETTPEAGEPSENPE